MIMFKKLFNTRFLLVAVIVIASFLRLYKLSVNPPSLFGDELDLGYQAYSILKTGRDYQENFMPLNFHSIAEYRTPLYLYSAVPTVAIFGITPLGVRLPAAIFGILGVLAIYFLVKELTGSTKVGLISSFLLAISPWDLQYSRAGFEVTEMLFFFILGIYFFLRALKNGKWLWVSVFCLTLTPWIYSTAKFFIPFLMIGMFLIWRKEIFSLGKINLVKAVIAGLVVGLPLIYGIFFGGASQRFNYISVFADPTVEPEIGNARLIDAQVRGETGAGISPKLMDKIIHNKFTFWGDAILKNYLSAFSTDFLFIKGDPDPRQSVGIGEMYRIELVALIFGLVFLFTEKKLDKKLKIFMAVWILAAPIPSALTTDGGNHATRLILMLPPLTILAAYGWNGLIERISGRSRVFVVGTLAILYFVSIFLYMHEYWVHWPLSSERWWHYGWGQSISEIKSIDSGYNKVIISMSGEPAWIFFAAYYQYPPDLWQKNFPIGRDAEVAGFGKISHIDKFYFGSPDKSVQIYGLGPYIDTKTLYLANASEIGTNLIIDPKGVPPGLKLIKAIAFPSGEPAFYLFTKQ